MSVSLLDPLDAWERRMPDQVLFQCGSERITRREFQTASTSVAARLAALGVVPGDPVAVIGGISFSWCIAGIGSIRAGGVLTPLNSRCVPEELAAMIESAGARVIIAEAAFYDNVLEAVETRSAQVVKMDEICAPDSRLEAPDVRSESEDPVLLAYTSGSTGLPKAATHTHASLLGAFQEWSLQVPTYRPHCRILNTAEFGFTGGLLHGLLAPAVFGGSCVLLARWDAAEALRLLQEGDIEILAVPIIFYEEMAALPQFEDATFPHLTAALTGGAPVPVAVLKAWHKRGVVLRQGYGLTEAGSIITYPSHEIALEHPDTVGMGGILTTIRLVTEDGADCPPGIPGEIVVRGPGLARGYWRAPELTADLFREGWLHTGDVGTIDDQGLLRVVGRLKDMIISGGMNIYAAELERVINDLAQVEEVAVIGVADERFGETPAALIRTIEPLAVSSVLNHCKQHLASYKLPRYVIFVEEVFPRTMGGKVRKDLLRAEYIDLLTRTAPAR